MFSFFEMVVACFIGITLVRIILIMLPYVIVNCFRLDTIIFGGANY